jgi:hypothetical protein
VITTSVPSAHTLSYGGKSRLGSALRLLMLVVFTALIVGVITASLFFGALYQLTTAGR